MNTERGISKYSKRILPSRPIYKQGDKMHWEGFVNERVYGSYSILTEKFKEVDTSGTGLVPREHFSKGLAHYFHYNNYTIYL